MKISEMKIRRPTGRTVFMAILVGFVLCISTPAVGGPTDGSVTLIPLFPDQFENTKYSIAVLDPDGIQEFLVDSSSGSFLFAGGPPCLQTVNSSTVTISVDMYPLSWTITDCAGNIFSGTTVCPARQCGPPPGLVSWWPGDADAADILGGNDGTLVNGTTVVTGKVGNAFSFDGIDDFVQVPDSDLWAFGSSNFTINLWANFRSIDNHSVLIGNDEGPTPTNKWLFVWSRSAGGALVLHFNGSTGSGDLVFAPFTPNLNQWHHLAITRSGDTFTIYADGNPIGSETRTVVIPNPSAPLTIGQAEGQFFLNGLIDEVQIYNRALTDNEIRIIFLAGSAGLSKSDVDLDGVLDLADNCPTVSNADQTDVNGDGFGDACVSPTVNIPPSSDFGSNPIIGSGTTIGIGVSVGDDAEIGSNVALNKNITAGDDLTIGDGSTIDQGASFGENVTIGANVTIGRNAVIGSGVVIGDNTVVGQGAIIGTNAQVGSNVKVGTSASVAPGAVVPNGTSIGAKKSYP